MHARRPPRCCLTLQRHPLPVASDGIWITDRLLAAAFERYCAVSSHVAGRRRASSVPGPMEARRRLGKRQMTEAFRMHPSAPSWAFQYPADLSQWRWEPPRWGDWISPKSKTDDPGALHPQHNTFIDSVKEWWEHEDAVEPDGVVSTAEAQPQTIGVQTPAVKTPSVLFMEEVRGLSKALSKSPPEKIITELQSATDNFHQYLALGLLSEHDAVTASNIILRILHKHIGLSSGTAYKRHQRVHLHIYSKITKGVLSSRPLVKKKLKTMWKPILEGAAKLPVNMDLYILFKNIMAAPGIKDQSSVVPILKGMAKTWIFTTENFGDKETAKVEFSRRWRLLFAPDAKGIQKGRDSRAIIGLVQAACKEFEMFSARISTLKAVVEGSSMREANFVADAATRSLELCERALGYARGGISSSLPRVQMSFLAEGLRGLNYDECSEMLTAMRDTIAACVQEEAAGYDASFLTSIYLDLVSQLPNLRQRHLCSHICLVHGGIEAVGRTESALSNAELCVLTVEKWFRRELITYREYRYMLRWLTMGRDANTLGYLIEGIFRVTPHRTLFLYQRLWTVLALVGRTGQLLPALQQLRLNRYNDVRKRTLPNRMLQLMARATITTHRRDSEMFIAIRSLRTNVDELEARDAWYVLTDAEQAVLDKLADEKVKPSDVFESIGAPLIKHKIGPKERHLAHAQLWTWRRMSSRSAALLAKMCVALSRAEHLSHRQAFRWVNHCVLLLRRDGRHREELSAAVQTLSEVLTRDLVNGHRTTPARLIWLVKLVRELEGDEEAEAVRASLSKWMEHNDLERDRALERARYEGRVDSNKHIWI